MTNDNDFSDFHEPSGLPEEVLINIKEHTESFVLISFDKNGFPITTIHAPSAKDFLALERLVMDLGVAGLPLPEDVGDEHPEDNEGDDWKHQ